VHIAIAKRDLVQCEVYSPLFASNPLSAEKFIYLFVTFLLLPLLLFSNTILLLGIISIQITPSSSSSNRVLLLFSFSAEKFSMQKN
jgi:hypothetical protein